MYRQQTVSREDTPEHVDTSGDGSTLYFQAGELVVHAFLYRSYIVFAIFIYLKTV